MIPAKGDIAYRVLYLVSDESQFVTGSELVIDGGYTARWTRTPIGFFLVTAKAQPRTGRNTKAQGNVLGS
jgi:hypothetical protein